VRASPGADASGVLERIDRDGFTIIEGVLEPEFCSRARAELEQAIEREAAYHGGTDYGDYGMVLLCSLYGGAFIELLDSERLLAPFEAVMGPGCIIYAYTSSSMPPGKTNFSRRIHVDSPRLIPGHVTNMGATILLDDFTADNGATCFLPGSHTRADPPSEAEYQAGAQRVIAPAGSVFFFNARLWHSGGDNTTDGWRHAVTINMCRPYMKQRLDIPRAMAEMDLSAISARAQQKLGFLAQVPASYDEYYVPPEQRKFKQPAE
jgi:ectoine hydroxylase-related dioxygenase (phytanoyl-CoA dioxygenase family)